MAIWLVVGKRRPFPNLHVHIKISDSTEFVVACYGLWAGSKISTFVYENAKIIALYETESDCLYEEGQCHDSICLLENKV